MAVALKKLDRTIMELNPDKSSLLKQFPGFDHEESVQIRNFAGGEISLNFIKCVLYKAYYKSKC